MAKLTVFCFIFAVSEIFAWPDGAPCLSKVMKNMYPAAPEHAGGLRTDDPPYRITVSNLCYQEGSKIIVGLEAQEGYRFKGFALQARIVGSKKRIGAFARDDNGSWKFQCFGKKNAITHSHPDNKKKVPVLWSTWDKHQNDIQFVATVVQSIKSYWYETVTSVVLPHCARGMATTVMPYGDDILYQPALRDFSRGRFDPNTIEPTRTTPPATTPSTTTPAPTTTKGPCIDKHTNCDAWKNFCTSGNWYVLQQCRVTCKDCVPGGNPFAQQPAPFTPAPHRPVTFAPPPTQPPRPRGNCPDRDSNCAHWYDMCSWRSEIREKCPGTCNTCHLVPSQTHPPQNNNQVSSSCIDKDANCPGWKGMCSTFEHIRKKCHRTCKVC